MNAAIYSDILDDNLHQSILDIRLRGMLIFWQENNAKHTVRITKEWLQDSL